MLDFSELSAYVRKRRFEAGQFIIRKGTPVESVFLLLSGGGVAIGSPSGDRQVTLFRIESGELLGEDHLDQETYRYTVITDSQTEIAFVDRVRFLGLVSQNRQWLTSILDSTIRRNQLMTEAIERLCIASAEERVYSLLSSIARKNQTQCVDVRGRVRSLSQDINLTPEACYRAIKKMQSRGTIRRLEDGRLQLLGR